LAEAVAHDAGDFFEFDLARGKAVEVDRDHPLERALSVPVVARIGGTVFADFSIDLALPRDGALSVDWITPEATLTGEPAVDAIPDVAVLALGAQVADKVCAMFERHGLDGHASSRARDLADIAMIATQENVDGTELAAQLRREERRRLDARRWSRSCRRRRPKRSRRGEESRAGRGRCDPAIGVVLALGEGVSGRLAGGAQLRVGEHQLGTRVDDRDLPDPRLELEHAARAPSAWERAVAQSAAVWKEMNAGRPVIRGA
jgi:hypothetical protein